MAKPAANPNVGKRFLKKRGDPYLYQWTKTLAERGDMFEVDADGRVPRSANVEVSEHEAEVLALTTKDDLKLYAESKGVKLTAKTVKAMQRELLELLDDGEEESEETDENSGESETDPGEP